ncbi:unnamed protein product [Prorocentrum cordatum]|uniref:Uncharacterized protein n=1 Tax=Prorocentrum cordatum TaxID=2364126 RepID=A0ABN9VP64_9DINO|nr:unnamed protein product [Polarella glacialis]
MAKYGKQGFSTCVHCGNWAWNWRLKKQKGACAVSNTPQPGWSTTARGKWWAPWSSGGGWHEHGQSEPSLANLGDYLSKALAGAGLAGDPDATRLATEFSILASQKLVPAAAPPEPPHALLKALERAAKTLVQARLQLEKAHFKFDEAADAVMAAELHRLEVQEAANPPETAKQSLFGVDPELLESLDELEENDKQAPEQLQRQLQDLTQQAEARQKELQTLLERARSAHQVAAQRRKRGADGEAVEGGAGGTAAANSRAPATLGAAAAAAGPSKSKAVVQESDQKAMLERIKTSAQSQAREAAASKAAGSGKGGAAGSGKGPAGRESKRSKKREEKRQRRLQAFPIELQEGFDELEPPASPPAPSVSFAIPEDTWFEAQTQLYWEGCSF